MTNSASDSDPGAFDNEMHLRAEAEADMEEQPIEHEELIKGILSIEREYFFEKRAAKTERQRKLRELLERYAGTGESCDDSN